VTSSSLALPLYLLMNENLKLVILNNEIFEFDTSGRPSDMSFNMTKLLGSLKQVNPSVIPKRLHSQMTDKYFQEKPDDVLLGDNESETNVITADFQYNGDKVRIKVKNCLGYQIDQSVIVSHKEAFILFSNLLLHSLDALEIYDIMFEQLKMEDSGEKFVFDKYLIKSHHLFEADEDDDGYFTSPRIEYIFEYLETMKDFLNNGKIKPESILRLNGVETLLLLQSLPVVNQYLKDVIHELLNVKNLSFNNTLVYLIFYWFIMNCSESDEILDLLEEYSTQLYDKFAKNIRFIDYRGFKKILPLGYFLSST
jgi:hypothetical protein